MVRGRGVAVGDELLIRDASGTQPGRERFPVFNGKICCLVYVNQIVFGAKNLAGLVDATDHELRTVRECIGLSNAADDGPSCEDWMRRTEQEPFPGNKHRLREAFTSLPNDQT